MTEDVDTRPVGVPGDDAFVLAVFDSVRRAELSLSGWPAHESDAFIAMQFEAQRRHFAAAFPEADHQIILVAGQPAGRLVVDRHEKEMHIVDIALLPPFRDAGVGGTVVRRLCAEAEAGHLPVRCHVALGNEARHFWAHLGFEERRLEAMDVALERPYRPSTT